MQLFITVLTEGHYASTILKKFADNNYHGSVLATQSIRHALMDSVEPLPYFGGFSKLVDSHEEYSRPMLFVVVKNDEEVKVLAKLVKISVLMIFLLDHLKIVVQSLNQRILQLHLT